MTDVSPETRITYEETSENGEYKTYYMTSIFDVNPIKKSEKDAKVNKLIFNPVTIALDKKGQQIGRAELELIYSDIDRGNLVIKKATYRMVGTVTFCNDILEDDNKIKDIYSLQINFS